MEWKQKRYGVVDILEASQCEIRESDSSHRRGHVHVPCACRAMVLVSIKLPICSAAQPADAIQRFVRAWEEEKTTLDYMKRRDISERSDNERKALKNSAHVRRVFCIGLHPISRSRPFIP